MKWTTHVLWLCAFDRVIFFILMFNSFLFADSCNLWSSLVTEVIHMKRYMLVSTRDTCVYRLDSVIYIFINVCLYTDITLLTPRYRAGGEWYSMDLCKSILDRSTLAPGVCFFAKDKLRRRCYQPQDRLSNAQGPYPIHIRAYPRNALLR